MPPEQGNTVVQNTFGPVWKYSPLYLNIALHNTFSEDKFGPNQAIENFSSFYKRNAAIVMQCMSDIDDKAGENLENALTDPLIEKEASQKPIVIPVSEQRKILGFPRNHWVTVHYDPKTNTATVLDSKPWYISMFYSTKPIKQILQKGLSSTIEDTKLAKMKIKTISIGVQKDDYSCGPRTREIVASLADGNSIDDTIKIVKQTKTDDVVADCAKIANLTVEKPASTSWLGRLWNRFVQAFSSHPKENEFPVCEEGDVVIIGNTDKHPSQSSSDSGSYSSISSQLQHRSRQAASVNDEITPFDHLIHLEDEDPALIPDDPAAKHLDVQQEGEILPAGRNPYHGGQGGITSGTRPAFENETDKPEDEKEEERKHLYDLTRPM